MISILIPAYNEKERIGATIAGVREIHRELEIIVADDGSDDNTAEEAEQAGAEVVLRLPHSGKGAALQAAYKISQGDTLLLLDADIGDSAREAERLLDPVLSNHADMTIAILPFINKGGGLGIVVRLARWGIKILTGYTSRSPLCGQRALRRSVIQELGGFESGWGVEIGLTVGALRCGRRIMEVETPLRHRVTGRSFSEILHRAAQAFAVVKVLFKLWIRYHNKASLSDSQ